MTNHWAGVSGNGNRIILRRRPNKKEKDIYHHGPKHIPIICHLPNPPSFSLPTTFNSISTALNDNKYCIGIFLDLKKAFNTVLHNILLQKLEKMGIKGTELLWFTNFLSNRTQRVKVNGTLSESAELEMFVFQGTILKPTLFSCFIKDLPNSTDLITFLYADDTSGLDSDPNTQALSSPKWHTGSKQTRCL
jgi:hypothetical protein